MGLVVGLVLTVLGAIVIIWALRTVNQVSRLEREELLARGLDDGLPWGVFREGQRIGLEAADLWLLFSGLLAGIGLVFLVSGIADAQVGWQVAAGVSMVGFAPAALCLRLGTGVPYWLTPEGVVKRARTRPSVLWTEVERIAPLFQGTPARNVSGANAFELQGATPRRGLRGWLGSDLTIKVMALEVDPRELSILLDEFLTSAGTRSTHPPSTE